MADTAQRPTSAAVRSLGELGLAAADRYSGDAMRAPGRPADHLRRVRPRDPRDRRRPGLAGRRGRRPRRRSSAGPCRSGRWPTSARSAAGATVVPVYHTNSPEECEYVLSHAGVKVLLLEDAAQAAKIAKVRDDLPELEHVVVLHGRGRGRDHARRPARARRRRGRDDRARAHRGRRARGRRDDRLHVRHDRAAEGLRALAREPALHRQRVHRPARACASRPPVIFQYLPLAHVLARMVSFVAIDTGGVLAFWSGDTKKLAEEIAEAEPTHIPTVPRLLEKIHTRVIGQAARRAAPRPRSSRARWRPARRSPRPSARARKVSPLDQRRATRSATGSRCRRCATRSAPATRS